MALNDLIATLVGVANALTAPLQATVEHYVFKEFDAKGKPVHYETPDLVACVVELGQNRRTVTERGEQAPLKAVLTFPRPVTVHPQDKFVLPDRTTGPVISIDGVVNPGTGARYATAVSIGA